MNGVRSWAGLTYLTDVTIEVLIGIGVFALVVAVIIGLVYVVSKNEDRAKKVGIVLTAPLWGPIFLLLLAAEAIYDRYEAGFDRVGRWVRDANLFVVVRPWTVPIAAGLTAWGYFDLKSFLGFAAAMGILAAIIAIGVSAALGIDFVVERRKESRRAHVNRPPSRPMRVVKGTVATAQVAGHYAMAKKKGICPFITFERQREVAA